MNSTKRLYGCNGDVSNVVPKKEAHAYASFLLLQLLLSAFGNVLVCLAITRFSHLRTLTNAFIFSLAVTDFLIPFVRLLYISAAMFSSKWIFGCFWCKFSSVLGVLLCASSIMHLSVISVERFIVIKWPFRHQNWINRSRVAFVIANIWIISIFLSLFPYLGLVQLSFNFELLDCEISWTHNPKMALLLTLFFFLFPFLVMSLTYYYIFKEARDQSRRISAVQITDSVGAVNNRSSFGFKIRINRILRQELKAVKIILVVIGAFFLFWLPFFTVTPLRAYKPSGISGSVQRLAFALAYSNSSCNWIIYSVMNREIREAFKVMLTSCGNSLPNSIQDRAQTVWGATRRVYNAIRSVNILNANESSRRLRTLSLPRGQQQIAAK